MDTNEGKVNMESSVHDMTLEQIIDEINKSDETIYNIAFRNEGWVFVLWIPARCDMRKNESLQPGDTSWTKGLIASGSYPTIREAAEATLKQVSERSIAIKKGLPQSPEHPESQLIKEGTIPDKETHNE